MPYTASLFHHKITSVAAVLTAAVLAVAGVLAAPGAQAASAVARPAASGGSVPVASLTTTGTRTDIVVRGLHSRPQARWVDYVVDQKVTGVDGCLADPSGSSVRSGVYRTHVNLLCAGGPAQARAAAARLVAGRPWYRVQVRSVPVVAFTFLAGIAHGNGDAVPAGLAQLPTGDFTIADGDDVSLTYVGQGVTQTQLDAALAAFARALHLSPSQVKVTPISWS